SWRCEKLEFHLEKFLEGWIGLWPRSSDGTLRRQRNIVMSVVAGQIHFYKKWIADAWYDVVGRLITMLQD
ncbi:hypothetical protein BDFB_014157, partial [Asbolus verrucosus]